MNKKETQKQKTKAAIGKFEPSKGDESYLNPPDKKGKAVIEQALMGGSTPLVKGNSMLAKNAQLERALPKIAIEINLEWDIGQNMRRQTCDQFMKVGALLNEARKHFASDVKFGSWRKKMVNFSQSHVQRLMQVATEFGDVENAALVSFGTLAVLTNASEKVKGKVIADAEDGKTTTRAEATEAKKADKAKDSPPESADAAAKDMESSGKEPPAPPVEDPKEEWETAQVMLDMPFHKRAPLVNLGRSPFHSACILYGVPPFHDGFPSLDLVSNLYMSLTEKLGEDDTELFDKLTEAHDILQMVIKQA